jgi:DNA-binding transcriptional MerR regulator
MRIGELADGVGVTTKTIRYYESVGLLPEAPRTASGYRTYEEADRERVRFIRTAQGLGMSLDEIKEIVGFRDRGEHPCRYVAGVLDRQVRDLNRRIREMGELRDELMRLQANTLVDPAPAGAFCGVIEHARWEAGGRLPA